MKSLKPFFCYFGGKWRAAKHYPSPEHDRIIEPFAGAAGYSLRHYTHEVILYDVDPAIYGVWQYLINVTPEEIRKLPLEVDHVDNFKIPQEAKWLIGFWLNKGSVSPSLTPSSWMRSGVRPNSYWGETIRDRIAQQVTKIKHWKIVKESYKDAEDTEATWFVDPPYQGECGKFYRYKIEEYKELGDWCRRRKGQVIVCERDGADWLPFQLLAEIKTTPGSRGKSYSKEVVWLG